jgi:hypothetical protein
MSGVWQYGNQELMHLPNCCGSEDGELFTGIDITIYCVLVTIWHCNTCGVNTITEIITHEEYRNKHLQSDTDTDKLS